MKSPAIPSPGRNPAARSPGLLLALGIASILTLTWIIFMVPEWIGNPDLSHGLLAPVLAVVLIREARTHGYARYLAASRSSTLLIALLLAVTMATLVFACLIAAALSWSNHLTAFLLAVALSTLMMATWLVCARDEWRWVPFVWPAFVACLLPLLSAPFPPGTYSRLTLSLQLAVTRGVIGTLHLLGIPAQRSGNIIELASTRVGIEDACSGIRSLVSCLVAALFFSGTLLSRAGARIVLVALSVPLALSMNFVRSLVLTLLANRGIDVAGTVHTLSGYVGLVLCALALAALARGLERRPPLALSREPASGRPSRLPVRLLLGSTLLCAVCVGLFMLKTRPPSDPFQSAPDLASLLPATYPGWSVETNHDLYRFSSTLQTGHLAQRTYLRDTASGTEQLTIYLAYWRPGQASVGRVTAHTPDACWPGAGWQPLEERSAQSKLSLADRSLPPAEYRTFQLGSLQQHVWFWHLHNRRPVIDADPFSPLEMARLVIRYGIQSDSDQMFIRLSSNVPWAAFAHEPLLEEISRRLQPFGL